MRRNIAWLAGVVWGWPFFVANLFRFASREEVLLLVALSMLALGLLPRWRWQAGTRLLSALPWGPAAPLLGWGMRRWWQNGLLTLLAIAGTCLHALLVPGLARQEYCFQKKVREIGTGRVVYMRDWGWLDREHMHLDEETCRKLMEGQHELRTLLLGGLGYEYHLEVTANSTNSKEAWRISELLAERMEEEQARLPWWTGGGLSAYNEDDLSAVYFSLYRQAYPDPPFQQETREEALQRWQHEGRAFVARRVARPADFQPTHPGVAERYRALFAELAKLHPAVTVKVR